MDVKPLIPPTSALDRVRVTRRRDADGQRNRSSFAEEFGKRRGDERSDVVETEGETPAGADRVPPEATREITAGPSSPSSEVEHDEGEDRERPAGGRGRLVDRRA